MRHTCPTLCLALALAACDAPRQDGQEATSHTSTAAPDNSATGNRPADGSATGARIPGSIENGMTVTKADQDQAFAEAVMAAEEAAAKAELAAALADAAAAISQDESRARMTQEERDMSALRLTVLVVDRNTGKGAEGVRIRWGRTDAEGRIDMRRPMPDEGELIEIHCETRADRFGPLLGSAPFAIENGRAHAAFEIDPARCVEPPMRTWRQRFAGMYGWGFEISSFFPCEGMPAESDFYQYSGGFWTELDSPGIWEAISEAAGERTSFASTKVVYVEWLGTATGPGSYGHMGGGLYMLKVEALYRASATAPASCGNAAEVRARFLPPPAPPPPVTDAATD